MRAAPTLIALVLFTACGDAPVIPEAVPVVVHALWSDLAATQIVEVRQAVRIGVDSIEHPISGAVVTAETPGGTIPLAEAAPGRYAAPVPITTGTYVLTVETGPNRIAARTVAPAPLTIRPPSAYPRLFRTGFTMPLRWEHATDAAAYAIFVRRDFADGAPGEDRFWGYATETSAAVFVIPNCGPTTCGTVRFTVSAVTASYLRYFGLAAAPADDTLRGGFAVSRSDTILIHP